MPSLKTALFLASGAVLLPSLADASGIPERALVSAARQTARNAMAKVVVSDVSDVSGKKVAETATASDRRGLAENDEVTRNDAWICMELTAENVCLSKDSEETCEAVSAFSCVWDDVEECSPDADKYANYGESFDSSTEPSFQKWNNTDYACAEYDSAETCNAQSDCFYYGDSESGSCDYSRIYIGSLLDEYCPRQTRALTSEEYVAEFDLCPWFTAISKCSLLSTQAACEADSDCEYNLDMTDPWSSKYPCESAGAGDDTFFDLYFTHHSADFLLADGFCQKTYYEQSACDADDACEWDDDSSSPCGWSTDALAAVFSGHPHLLRSYAVSQTCETIETEALCGVADTADKCEWLEASSGDEAGCHAIPTYAAQQLSCECDAVKTVVPSVDYSNVVCATPSVDFVDVYSGARAFEGGALLGGALTLAACVLALA